MGFVGYDFFVPLSFARMRRLTIAIHVSKEIDDENKHKAVAL